MCCGQDDDRFWQRVFVELMQCDSGVRGGTALTDWRRSADLYTPYMNHR